METLQKCYWNEEGKYQNIYSKLYADLVEDSGSSETVQGELIRAISRLYHEYCNNGNCNANDNYQVNSYYKNFLKLIREFVPYSYTEAIEVINVITQHKSYTFDGEERQAYIDLTDKVVSWVARNLNTKLEFPYWYERD